MLTSLILGLSYGFAAGVSPGPMLGLVITQTLQRGWRAGNLVALAPLLSDLPIIVLAVVLIDRLPPAAIGWLGIIGGLFVIYLGAESVRAHPAEPAAGAAPTPDDAPARVLGRAVLTNLLNPHPYLFWGTVGAPLIARALAGGPAHVALFLIGFYALLVGSKLLVALLVSRSRGWLGGRGYRRVLIVSGVLLAGLGLLLLRDGVLLVWR
ncbi:LysE family translocator [Kouleothrix sp.]|uniref:LysE family translocator n=1 Tax=Kouleothrix sp. TaxID=2779161 RepID=UPI0039194893